MDALKRLSFVIDLVDQVTGPVGKIQRSLGNLAKTSRDAFADIGTGALGIVGAGLALQSAVQPALEFDKALGELRALDIGAESVRKLGGFAITMSTQYGIAATEVLAGTNRIAGAIKGLTNSEFDAFTEATTALSVATKSGMDETAKYIGQMYSRFKTTADAMGKTQWVQQIASQTTFLKKHLGAESSEIFGAMEGLNNLGSGLGVGMSEQLAVLATLGKSTGLSEAEQQYTNFLEYAVSAQEKLGMSFMDSTGNLLPMMQILDKLKGKFGDLSGANTWAVLDDAFGDGSKLLQQLSKDTGALEKNIASISGISGLGEASRMTKQMTTPWDKLTQRLEAVKIGFGAALLPVLNPLVGSLEDGANKLYRWTDLFPEVTRWIGIGVASIIGITASMAALTLVVGISKTAWAGFMIIKSVGTAIAALLPTMKTLRMLTLTLAITTNAAVFPFWAVVGGIAAVVAAVGACIYWWDDLKAAFLDSSWGQGLMGLIDNLIGWFKNLQGIAGTAVGWVVDKLNMIPGIGGSDPQVGTVNRDMKMAAVGAGGVTNHMQKTFNQGSRDNRSQVTINTTQAPTQHLMDSWMVMEAF